MLFSREATLFQHRSCVRTLHNMVVNAHQPANMVAARSATMSTATNFTASSRMSMKIVSGWLYDKPQLLQIMLSQSIFAGHDERSPDPFRRSVRQK